MNKTKIEYLDFTLNPITGCSGYGCAVRKRCWAKLMAYRLKGRFGYPRDDPFKPTFHENRLDEPFKVKKSSIIGLCFMGDMFDIEVKREWQAQIHSMIDGAYWHIFFCLTKQPQNVPTFLRYPNNFWLGVSVNVKDDLWRIEELKRKHVAVKVVSFEPLYEHILCKLEDIDWIIIGAQTRPLRSPKRE